MSERVHDAAMIDGHDDGPPEPVATGADTWSPPEWVTRPASRSVRELSSSTPPSPQLSHPKSTSPAPARVDGDSR
ncbi:MAG: hypothetical protein ACKV2T_26200 [Kofleriaceae bacterium]